MLVVVAMMLFFHCAIASGVANENQALGMVEISYKPTTKWLQEFSRMVSIEKEAGEIKNIAAKCLHNIIKATLSS